MSVQVADVGWAQSKKKKKKWSHWNYCSVDVFDIFKILQVNENGVVLQREL